MKKVFSIFAMAALLAGCNGASQYLAGGAGDSTRAKLQACLMNEASSQMQSGTLFNMGITAKAKELSGTCIKKLALQSAGLDSEAVSSATNILTNLQSTASTLAK